MKRKTLLQIKRAERRLPDSLAVNGILREEGSWQKQKKGLPPREEVIEAVRLMSMMVCALASQFPGPEGAVIRDARDAIGTWLDFRGRRK